MHRNPRTWLYLLAIVSFMLACKKKAPESPTVSTSEESSIKGYVDTRGFKMYYEITGEGDPLLFIHGNGGSFMDFTHQIPFFKQHYKLILIDSRAQGKSTDLSDSLSYEMMADDLNALLDSLHFDSCYVIGWSDGGINGLLLAMRHPDKVKKLAITGANLWPDSTAVDPFAINQVKRVRDSIAVFPDTGTFHHVNKLFRLLGDEPHITTEQLKQVQCPTLVMGGDHDVILTNHTVLIANSIPKSYCYIFPNSGHGTLIRYKDEFNNKVLEFFQQPYREINGKNIFQ